MTRGSTDWWIEFAPSLASTAQTLSRRDKGQYILVKDLHPPYRALRKRNFKLDQADPPSAGLDTSGAKIPLLDPPSGGEPLALTEVRKAICEVKRTRVRSVCMKPHYISALLHYSIFHKYISTSDL